MTNQTINHGITIDPEDIEYVLLEYPDGYGVSILNAYFTNAAYDKPTQAERDVALLCMRLRWIEALAPLIGATAARDCVKQQEFYVRDAMNTVDQLPVPPMLWNPKFETINMGD